MTNEIDKPEHDYFGEFANAVLVKSIVGDLLLFSKFGEFVAGCECYPLALGTQLIAVMPQLLIGWVRWEDSHPVERRMGLIAKGFKPAKRAELGYLDQKKWPTDDKGEVRDPWQRTNYLIFVDPGEGHQAYTYSTTSRGGISALGELAKDYSAHCRQTPGEYPIATLGKGSYRHPDRKIGEVRYPIFKRTGWTARGPIDDLLRAVTGGDDDDGGGGDDAGGAAIEPPTNAEPADVKPADKEPAYVKPAAKKPPSAPRI
jgi:hypothetical protein